jgi:uncharacterized protein YqgQ
MPGKRSLIFTRKRRGQAMKVIMKSLIVLMAALLMAGCIGLSFTEKKYETNRHVSLGTELIELRTAYDEGLLSEKEYETARQDILKQDKPEETDKPAEKEEKEEQH